VSTSLAPVGIASAEVVGPPAVLAVVIPAGILSEELFGDPTVSVPYVISPDGIASEEDFGTATVTIVYAITGIVKDRQGNPVPGADVNLFNAVTHALVHNGVSDSDGRYYAVVTDNYTNHFMVAFFGTSPRKVGATVDTLKGK
jgi:hypothetical protein